MVAISRSRSVMLMLVRLYSTINASAAAQTTMRTTMALMLFMEFSIRFRISAFTVTKLTLGYSIKAVTVPSVWI